MDNYEENEKIKIGFDKIFFTVHSVLIDYMVYDRNIKSINVSGANFNRCIEASAEYIDKQCICDELTLWIRLIQLPYFKYTVDISSISIPEKLRRKGLMTELYTKLIKLDEVECIRITSVCTNEMKQWCRKMGLKDDGFSNWS